MPPAAQRWDFFLNLKAEILNGINPITKILPYFAKPVSVGDRDVVGAEVSAAAVPVEKRGQVWEIAVEVNVLGICPTVGPAVQQVALKR